MWSSVNEKITDGTSGLAPSSGAVSLVVGTSTKGSSNALTLGKKSDVAEAVGYGSMPNCIKDMQKTMDDVSILALRTDGDVEGTVSEIETTGDMKVTLAGTPLCATDVEVSVYTSGAIGQAEVQVVITGDIEKEEVILIPEDGIVKLDDVEISILFPTSTDLSANHSWKFSTTAPSSSLAVLEEAISNALEIYTPEVVVITQPVNADFVKSLGILAESLFDDHKPVLFLAETKLDSELSYTEAVAEKQLEFAKIDARFVSVVCQPTVDDSALGLCAGHITKATVNQSIGATNYFAIYDTSLPDGWTNTHSRALDESRLITLRTYAGLNNLFWTNGRTVASSSSDYRFIEVVRTVFKAIRLARIASLPYIQADGDDVGLQNLKAEIINAIDGMTTTTPKELDSYDVDMPSGQDIVNDGVRFDISLYGIPKIRTINLNFMFKYNEEE